MTAVELSVTRFLEFYYFNYFLIDLASFVTKIRV